MKNERRENRRDFESPRTCGNEGCARPAEGRYCDTCDLEWSLFHREERPQAPRPGVASTRRASEPAAGG